MSDSKPPGEPPEDLPPEYAEAYRRGYERAYREAMGEPPEPEPPEPEPQPEPRPEPEPEPEPDHGGTRTFEELLSQARTLPHEPSAHRGPAEGGHREPGSRPGWLVPAILGGLVLVLLLGAFAAGRIISSSMGEADVTTEVPDGVDIGDSDEATGKPRPEKSPSEKPSERPSEKPSDKPSAVYEGRTDAVTITSASASCESGGSVDAAGNPVSYAPQYAFDQDVSTAWRCDGDGVGESLTLALPGDVRIGEVGLVPGYAKTDPASDVDRYAENNRITRVRWTFADGTSVEQDLDGSPTNRSLQTLRIPETTSSSLVLEVLASTGGTRDTIAVSDLRVGAVAE